MNREEYFHSDWAKLAFSRTRFRMPFQHTTAFNVGDIIPLEVEQIYPGDSISSNFSYLLRMFTPISPVMSNMYLDVYSFFVPMRLVWEHWEEFYGQNNTSAWTQNFSYTIPQATIDPEMDSSDSDGLGSLADYLAMPLIETGNFSSPSYQVSDLWRRAYLCIYNNWFRDENVISPVLYSVGDTVESSPVFTYLDKPLKAAKFHDYFTALLPAPTKGSAPVIGDDLQVYGAQTLHNTGLIKLGATGETPVQANTATLLGRNSMYGGTYDRGVFATNDTPTAAGGTNLDLSNLMAKMTVTIEDIRNAAVITHVLERLASSGSRYVESLVGLWGVTPSNASLQIPEYLGGKRFSIQMSDLVSTANTVDSNGSQGSPIGEPGAYLKNGNGGALFNKAFTEHGMLFTVAVVRVEQTYFQGLDRKFSAKSFFDFYLPQTANIGNQPVYKEEANIMAVNLASNSNNSQFRKSVLGYSEAWAHLRYTPYRLTSIMNPLVQGGLSHWTATGIVPGLYNSTDILSLNKSFIEQSANGLDRCIAVPSSTRLSFQFFGDFHFENIWTRILPAHSLPGLTRI